jgi:hypothetical protein
MDELNNIFHQDSCFTENYRITWELNVKSNGERYQFILSKKEYKIEYQE